ncbi:MAG: hypothetical protein ABI867_01565 [Kofleriaceae bacterium]
MRVLALGILVACAHKTTPTTRLDLWLDGYQVPNEHWRKWPQVVTASVGSQLEVRTTWGAECTEPKFIKGSDRKHACDVVDHRVQVRCDTPCTILDTSRKLTENVAISDWGAKERAFLITPKGSRVRLEVEFENKRGRKRIERLPEITLGAPNELLLQCTVPYSGVYTECAAGVPSTIDKEKPVLLEVRAKHGESLGVVKIDGKLARMTPIRDLVPKTPDGKLVPGVYNITVEVHPAPHTIKQDVVIQILPE